MLTHSVTNAGFEGGVVPDFPVEKEKVAARHHLLRARRALPTAVREAAARALQAAAGELVRTCAARRIAAYLPVGAEPGGADLVDALHRALPAGGDVLLPVLLADLDLDWAAYTGPDRLAPGRYGLREPTGPHLGPAAAGTADLMLVPALAVDHRGHRLGRGGGSYDRALARVRPGTPVVALLYDHELVPAVPSEPHDRRVTAVITPSHGYRSVQPA